MSAEQSNSQLRREQLADQELRALIEKLERQGALSSGRTRMSCACVEGHSLQDHPAARGPSGTPAYSLAPGAPGSPPDWHVDFVGPLKPTPRGNICIFFTAVDKATYFLPVVQPLPEMTASL
jgi:hypothetical protein